MNKVTALLLNWQRPANLKVIIENLRLQTVPVEIFLWNNNQKDENHFDVDLEINSSNNLFCFTRWLMSSFAESDYVLTLDDDLSPKNKNTIENCMNYLEKNKTIDMIGYTGVKLNDTKQYWKSYHIAKPDQKKDISVDIIKGRFIFARKSFLSNISFPSEFLIRGDDIFVSSFSANKILPSFLFNSFQELDSGTIGLCNDKKLHKRKRQEVVNRYFGN